MTTLTFDILKSAWNRLKKERAIDLKKLAPDLTDPNEIYVKRVSEDEVELVVQFSGFRASVQDQTSIPQVKRIIMTWLKNTSISVQLARSDENTLLVRLTKDTKFSESRNNYTIWYDPKTNKAIVKPWDFESHHPFLIDQNPNFFGLTEQDVENIVQDNGGDFGEAIDELMQVVIDKGFVRANYADRILSIETFNKKFIAPTIKWAKQQFKRIDGVEVDLLGDGNKDFEISADQVDNILMTGNLGEAAISIFKRDPKTNKKMTYYKCIGGKKNGRRVSDPNKCIGVPDPVKKIKFAITKRAKYGQASKSKKKTQLTNITARRIRKANQRLTKARGF